MLALARKIVAGEIEGSLDERRPHHYPVYNAPATAGGEVLFATRTVDPVAAAEESRRSGLRVSTTVTDALWPSEELVRAQCVVDPVRQSMPGVRDGRILR